MFRTVEARQKIISNLGESYCVENLISSTEISRLIEIYESWDSKIYKNTVYGRGPITTNITELLYSDPILTPMVDKIESYIGKHKIEIAIHFDVIKPHIIHMDDFHDRPDSLMYKAITIPLRIEYNEDIEIKETPFLCTFDQYYLEGPAKFFKDNTTRKESHHNTPIYEYSQVQNKTDIPFPEEIRLKYFNHLNPVWLEGLSFNSAHSWIPGNAIFFDCVRLHCASDFRKLGIKSKLGLSIFTSSLL